MWCCVTPAWGRDRYGPKKEATQVNQAPSGLFKASWRIVLAFLGLWPASSCGPSRSRDGAPRTRPVATAIRCRSNSPQLTRHARGSALHQPGRPGVLASPTPPTRRNDDNPRKSDAFGASDRIHRGVAESGCGVVFRNRSDPSPRRPSLASGGGPGAPASRLDGLRDRMRE
jgi:hypothetical protein